MGRAFLITILPITNAEERRVMENSERKTAFLLGEPSKEDWEAYYELCEQWARAIAAAMASVEFSVRYYNKDHLGNIRVSKEYNQDFSAAGQTISAKCVDDFTRTNRVFGVGVDFDL